MIDTKLHNTSNTLPFTGERYHPEVSGEMRQEHLHRYAWVLNTISGKTVVDLASGEGFGSALMAKSAASVTGIELCENAVAHARSRYRLSNLQFLQGDAASLPLADNVADVVVSFETVEHVQDQIAMVAEIRRVLKPTGFLIMSSPDPTVYSEKQGHRNPFHVQELTRSEFQSLLRTHFGAVAIYGQRLSIASSILPPQPIPHVAPEVFDDNGTLSRDLRELPFTMYLVAIAASSLACLPTMPPSLLVASSYDIYWATKTEMAQLKEERRQLLELSHARAIAKSEMFEPTYYTRQHANVELPPDIFELALHYVRYGEHNGHLPSPAFHPTYYLSSNPDVAASGINALYHFITAGQKEGRLPKPPDSH